MPLSRAKLDSGEYPYNLSVGPLSEIDSLHIVLIDGEPGTICRSNALIVVLIMASSIHGEEKAAQVEFTSPTPLLSSDGSLAAWGWSKHAMMTYNRDAIPAARLGRVKEWEHYTVMSPPFTVGVTIAQLGSLSFGSAEIIDYKENKQQSAMFFGPPLSKSKSIFTANSFGNSTIRSKENIVSFKFENNRRLLSFHIEKTATAPAFVGEIELVNNRSDDSIAIARPFAGPGQFFYENKIFGMPASGSIKVDDKEYALPKGNAFAIFDWGRGIWPRTSAWFWGQAAGTIEGHQVAINLGDVYGDDSRGTANAILLDGKLHKLHELACDYDPADQMKPWKFKSDDGRLSLTFTPIYHQEAKQEILLAATELHKIHGHYSGTLIVDGKTITVKNLLGFAEHMSQRW